MDEIIIVLLMVGIFTLSILNEAVYKKIQSSQLVWFVLLFAVTIIPLLVSLLFSEWETIGHLFCIYGSWYLIPIILLSSVLFIQNSTTLQPKHKQISSLILLISGVTILGLGLDLRTTKPLYAAIGEAYSINAIQVSLILILFAIKLRYLFPSCPYPIQTKIIAKGSMKLIALFIILVPIGLISSFLKFNPQLSLENIPIAMLVFLGIYITIALPEELLMRVYIQHSIDSFLKENLGTKKEWVHWITLFFISFVFGMSHWNNTSLQFVPWYILLATIAGIFYGLAWRSGKLHEAVFIHTAVDWIWNYFLAG